MHKKKRAAKIEVKEVPGRMGIWLGVNAYVIEFFGGRTRGDGQLLSFGDWVKEAARGLRNETGAGRVQIAGVFI